MPTLDVFNIEGKKIDKVEVSDSVFNVELHKNAISDCVIQEQANKRQGNAKAKDRSEVSGGGKRPWRQKAPAAPVTARTVRLYGDTAA